MKLLTLSPTDTQFGLATHKAIITYADLAAASAATTATFQIFPLVSGTTFPAGTVARFAGMNLVTAFDFSDAGITSCLLEIGDGGDTDRLLTQTELAVDGTEVLYKVEGATTQPYAYLVADTIDALFTVANGGSPLVTEATSGEVHIYLHISNPLEGLEKTKGTI